MRRKEDAIREGRRAVELEPESQDAFRGAACAANLALVYALTGEQDLAITLIERLLSTPGAVGSGRDFTPNITQADLRLRWEWDSLRSNPRFQKILAGPEPKTILTPVQEVAPATPKKSIAVPSFEAPLVRQFDELCLGRSLHRQNNGQSFPERAWPSR